MKLLAAIGVFLGFAALIGLGIVIAVSTGSVWLLLAGIGAFLFAFVKFGCLDHA
jgi:hypothetical protein